jgi:hypothetical protein
LAQSPQSRCNPRKANVPIMVVLLTNTIALTGIVIAGNVCIDEET